ncbi:hypothetical protein R1sor_013304 [Riccia sorocarpa]|uniref:Uncharacterized protein n=1 Tax=Riccia sorocarpa TaxID=122646 RepID=A0ABD3H9F6_9MARC
MIVIDVDNSMEVINPWVPQPIFKFIPFTGLREAMHRLHEQWSSTDVSVVVITIKDITEGDRFEICVADGHNDEDTTILVIEQRFKTRYTEIVKKFLQGFPVLLHLKNVTKEFPKHNRKVINELPKLHTHKSTIWATPWSHTRSQFLTEVFNSHINRLENAQKTIVEEYDDNFKREALFELLEEIRVSGIFSFNKFGDFFGYDELVSFCVEF